MPTCPVCGERFDDGAYCPTDGVELREDAPSERIGQIVGERYRIVAKLGEGGVGEIFAAEHLYVQKRVALKLLRPSFAADAEAVGRLEREARSASAIGHPNIVRVEDFGRSEGQAYLAMELLDGESLEDYIERGGGDLASSFELIAQVCDGLAAAHAAGVIHRDLKPANIVLTRGDDGGTVAKVLDFGIAKLATGDASLTRTGTLVGTPHYMAPEQALGAPVDHRADVYAVGVILYQLVTGAVPFSAESFIAVLHKHTTESPPPPSSCAEDAAVSASVDALILRCLEKDPDARWPDMASLSVELRQLASGREATLPATPAASPPTDEVPAIPEPSAEPAAETLAPPRRRPAARVAIAAVAAIGAVAAAAGLVALWGDDSATSADAAPAIAAPIDAASQPTPPDGQPDAPPDAAVDEEPEGWRIDDETDELSFAATVYPAAPQPRSRVDVELEIEPRDDELAESLTSEDAEARFVFEYYRDHRVVAEVARALSPSGSARAILSLPDPGKYHVAVSLRAEGREVARLGFDMCVGADPDDPASREQTCPGMGD